MDQQTIVFFGTPEFALPSLETLLKDGRYRVAAVVTRADKPKGRGQKTGLSPVKKLALQSKIPVLQPDDLNRFFIEKLKEYKPKLGVIAAYGKILPKEILNIFSKGIINIHGSFLPRYRGASPIAGAILAGEKETGVTLMQLSLKMDAGPLIARSEAVKIDRKTTGELSLELAELGAKLLREKLPPFLNGQLTPQKQDSSKATYTKRIKKEEAHLDFRKEAIQLEREIRAYNPWPISFAFWEEKQLKIYRAEISKQRVADTPGQVGLLNGKPAVQTPASSLILEELQLPGKKRVNGKNFITGYARIIGNRLT